MIWSNTLVLALMLLGALAYGFTGRIPQFRDRRAKGALLFSVGAAAVFVPPQFAVATILIGIGTRMVWDDRDDNGPSADISSALRRTTHKLTLLYFEATGWRTGLLAHTSPLTPQAEAAS
jgi:hypothetical protein